MPRFTRRHLIVAPLLIGGLGLGALTAVTVGAQGAGSTTAARSADSHRASSTAAPTTLAPTAAPTAAATAAPTAAPTAVATAAPVATPAPSLADARAAVVAVYANQGRPALPGKGCITTRSGNQVTIGDPTATYGRCPFSARLLARLQYIDSVPPWGDGPTLFARSNGPIPSIQVGQAFATGNGATVHVTMGLEGQGPRVLDAVLIRGAHGWQIDDLLFHGFAQETSTVNDPAVSVYSGCVTAQRAC